MVTLHRFRQIVSTILIGAILFLCCSCSNSDNNKNSLLDKDKNISTSTKEGQDDKSKISSISSNEPSVKFESYVNEKYGFSIKYPDSWSISQESPSGDGVVLYDKQENNIRVYGGYLLGDDIDTMEIDEAKSNGINVEELVTSNGNKGFKILQIGEDKTILHFIVYGKELHCHLYADVLSTFYQDNKAMFNEMAESIDVGE